MHYYKKNINPNILNPCPRANYNQECKGTSPREQHRVKGMTILNTKYTIQAKKRRSIIHDAPSFYSAKLYCFTIP